MIALNKNDEWLRRIVIVYEGDEELGDQLQEEFDEFGLSSHLLDDEAELFELECIGHEPEFLLLSIPGVRLRPTAIRDLRRSYPNIKLVLIAKDCNYQFVDLCLGLGVNAVISKFEDPEMIVWLTVLATADSK